MGCMFGGFLDLFFYFSALKIDNFLCYQHCKSLKK